MWGNGYGGMMGGGAGMVLLWVLVIAGVAALIFAVVQLAGQPRDRNGRDGVRAQVREVAEPPRRAAQPGPSPRLILEQRFARGEIDAEEFTERLRVLEGP
ncbi:MAG: SHOCT domain-containing protein [Actinomycetes bacterium]|jgi:putative membrane protein